MPPRMNTDTEGSLSPATKGGAKHTDRGKSSRSKAAMERSIAPIMKIHVIDEERTTMTDDVSVSESDTSSKGSNHSQHRLLEFMEAACMGSSWFTSCFPCAIVTINDSDDIVVDKLSRESAMNAMYSRNCTSATDIPIHLEDQLTKKGSENMGYHRQEIECPTRSLIDQSSKDEAIAQVASAVALNDDTGSTPVVCSHKCEDPSRVDLQHIHVVSSDDMKPTCSAPTKKYGRMKLFGRKKSESS